MDRLREQQDVRDWVVSEGYDTFCTLKFKNGYDIDERKAEEIVQLFLQKVDRTYWGKRIKQDLRCQRFVFLHKGISGQNTHYHLCIQSIGLQYTFIEILRRTWASFQETDQAASGFELARNTDATGTYLTHEWKKLGSRTFCDRLSYTASHSGIPQYKNIQKVRRLLKALEG
jgi:hypothetical protein